MGRSPKVHTAEITGIVKDGEQIYQGPCRRHKKFHLVLLQLFFSHLFHSSNIRFIDSSTLAAKPGRVVGPVIADENGRLVKEPYDPRTYIRGPILPPAYHYQKPMVGNQERSVAETKLDISLRAAKQASQCGMAASKIGTDIAISIDSNPFYMTRAGVNKVELKDQISIDANFLQAKAAQYGGLSAATATTTSVAHRKVVAGQFSMTKMY